MRSLTLSLILLAGVAVHADAQGSQITAPIAKAREAAAALDAHNKAQSGGQEQRRDSTQAPSDASGSTPKTRKPGGSKPPALPPALPPAAPTNGAAAKPGNAQPAPVKAETTAVASAAKTPVTKPADSAKAAPSGNAPVTPGAPSDKNNAPAASAQATPGKGTPAGGKAPGAKAPAAGTKAAPVTPDSAKTSATVEAATNAPPPTSVSTAAVRPEIAINREVFQYDAAGRRDPFASLLLTSDLRPLFSDLLLVVINYDPQGRNSVAIMRDASTKEQYRVRQGQLIGRMRVSAIEPKRVMFTIDEFGFSRQEALVIGDTTKVRKQ